MDYIVVKEFEHNQYPSNTRIVHGIAFCFLLNNKEGRDYISQRLATIKNDASSITSTVLLFYNTPVSGFLSENNDEYRSVHNIFLKI